MTAVLVLVALALGPAPGDRGGQAIGPDRGGQALAVVGYLDGGEPVTLVRELSTFPAFVCIHGGEADWPDDGDPYWGGLQMDRTFMRQYGSDMIRRHHGGLANVWTPAEQILVAHRAVVGWHGIPARGFGPWPVTRLDCGV